jgi:hypothetical protein
VIVLTAYMINTAHYRRRNVMRFVLIFGKH